MDGRYLLLTHNECQVEITMYYLEMISKGVLMNSLIGRHFVYPKHYTSFTEHSVLHVFTFR